MAFYLNIFETYKQNSILQERMESDLPDLTYEPSVSDSAPLLPLYSRTSRTSEDDSRGNDLHNRLKLRQLQPAGNFFSIYSANSTF